jgi:hypothetical protein
VITLSTGTRNALADRIDDLTNVSPPGKVKVYTAGKATLLSTVVLQNPAFGAAVVGVITLQGVPLSDTADANGDAAVFELTDGADAIVFEGTVGITGGFDMVVDNTNLRTGQTFRINSMTVTVPA